MSGVRALLLVAFLFLGGCTSFVASGPLFAPEGGAHPFPDGALIEMRHRGERDEDDPSRFVMRVAGGGYDVVTPTTNKAVIRGIIFTPAPDTPFEDYVMQAPATDPDDAPAVFFGFVWRVGGVYRMIQDPEPFLDIPEARAWMETRCGGGKDKDCVFLSGEDVLAFHRLFVAPIIRAGKTPPRFDDLVIVGRDKPLRRAS